MKFDHKKFAEIRRTKGISVKEIASFLDKSRKTLWNWEQGVTVPDNSSILALSLILDVPLNSLSDDMKFGDFAVTEKITIEKSLNVIDEVINNFNTELPIDLIMPLKYLSGEITALSRKNKLLEQRIDELIKMLDSVCSIVYMKDWNRLLTRVNKYFYNYVSESYDHGKVIGSRMIDIFGRNEIKKIVEFENYVFETGKCIFNREVYIPNTNSKEKGLISIVPVFDNENKVISIISSIKELTHLMYSFKHNKILKRLIDSIPDEFFWIWNQTYSTTMYLGRKVQLITGWTVEEIVKDDYSLLDKILNKEDLQEFNKAVTALKDNNIQKLRVKHKDGQLLNLEMRYFKLVEGDQIFYIGACRIAR